MMMQVTPVIIDVEMLQQKFEMDNLRNLEPEPAGVPKYEGKHNSAYNIITKMLELLGQIGVAFANLSSRRNMRQNVY